jgi:hypothetical protein
MTPMDLDTEVVTAKNKIKKPWKTGASSGHKTNLMQSILETFNHRHTFYIVCGVNISTIYFLSCL